ncbi:hypothetical protein L198_02081 [Cryptococcus wingfieldii CBS 7118]|uniref:Transmembrane protein n=1 Tax=Cryptococcus wingfieldii CBS 7118 TaxID=1295528 RepID=A0A1E3JWZ8_9TREE|nr:hypothetical protein L198_02081 [Cryptococcus wingfieldii CBS 7118]ODO05388.1 hypothetical protein L198_02081 [Cryptococcus wingfieldii CBS 7118]
MNITLDDTSPQFRYFSSGNTWVQNHAADPAVDRYYKKTFMGTHTDGDYVSLTFNGTAITIYGAKRTNHGAYSTQLDGGSTTLQIGYLADVKFQVPIFSAKSLSSDDEHTIILKNLPSQTSVSGTNNTEWWLDIDFAVITTSTQGKVWTTTYDDSSPALKYIGSGWNPNTSAGTDYFNRTAYITQTVGDSVSLDFNGSSVQVFGGLYNDHGNYSVSLDGGQAASYNGTFFNLQPGASLFQASGLDEGPHSVQLINLGQGPKGKYLDIDYIVVNSTVDPALSGGNNTEGDSISTSTASPASGNSSSSMTSGAIAGAVVGGIVGLALVVVLAWFLFRRNKGAPGQAESPYLKPGRLDSRMDLNGDEVKPFMSNDPHAPRAHPGAAMGAYYTTLAPHNPANNNHTYPLGPLGREDHEERTPFLNGIPAPPPSNALSYPRSDVPPNGDGWPPLPSSEGANNSSSGQSFKSAGISLPYTAHPPSQSPPSSLNTNPNPHPAPASSHQASSPGADLPNPHQPYASPTSGDARHSQASLGRMYVPGREQDIGPLGAGFDEAPLSEEVLPPDYSQATEPLPGQRRV